MYWSGGTGNTNDTVTLSVGVSTTASCVGFPAAFTWSTTYGSSGANAASPFTIGATGTQLTIQSGGSLCLRVTLTHNTGGKPSMLYDGAALVADTRVVPPTIVVPESVLGFAGLALLIPVFTGRRRLLAVLRKRL